MEFNQLVQNEKVLFNYIIARFDSLEEVEGKVKRSLFISNYNKKDSLLIASYKGAQFHFKDNKLEMWVLNPKENKKAYFTINEEKKRLHKLNLNQLLKILYKLNVKWCFSQKLCFLDQVTVQTENGISFIFGFDENSTKGDLFKVGFGTI